MDNLPEKTNNPTEIMFKAIESGIDIDKIEKMLVLQERWEANEAKKAYHLAMAKFKANPPEIEKDKRVSYEMTGGGTKSYNHASLANVTGKINSALSVQGLSATWDTAQGEGGRITVTCRITHEKGHSESTKLAASPDDSGKKNSIQAIGSTISYLERYTLLALTGLATHDMDNDGQAEEDDIEYINEKQTAEIRAMLTQLDRPEEKMCAHFKIESIEKMPEKRFNEIVGVLKESIKAMKKKDPVSKAGTDLKKIKDKKEEDAKKALIDEKNKELGADKEPGDEQP